MLEEAAEAGRTQRPAMKVEAGRTQRPQKHALLVEAGRTQRPVCVSAAIQDWICCAVCHHPVPRGLALFLHESVEEALVQYATLWVCTPSMGDPSGLAVFHRTRTIHVLHLHTYHNGVAHTRTCVGGWSMMLFP